MVLRPSGGPPGRPSLAASEEQPPMPVPRRRHCKGRRDRARTHKKLHASQLAKCADCGAPKALHRVCPACGSYKGRTYRATVTS